MTLQSHKTKIVATIGPASKTPAMLERLIRAGLNVARLNFSHGDFSGHAEVIANLRAGARACERRVAIMADLPGPKMRLGSIDPGPIQLQPGEPFILTSRPITGDRQRVSVSFERLPQVVKAGDRLFLNDGLVQLVVERVAGTDVHCTVAVGGELSSRKGLNLPGIDLGISAFTDHDRACLAFALQHGVDAVSQSFVESAADIEAVRSAARELGGQPFVIAKIERAGALDHFDEILAAADGVMVARGDLGVMLSGESAVGKYPEEAVAMLARIAVTTEAQRPRAGLEGLRERARRQTPSTPAEAIASVVEHALDTVACAAVLVPTRSGSTARMISRFKPAVWILAPSADPVACQGLAFSYGVHPIELADEPESWRELATRWSHAEQLPGGIAMLVAGPSRRNPNASYRVEFLRLSKS
jgi:pyruvate kinase